MGTVMVEGQVIAEWAGADGIMNRPAYALAFGRASNSALAWLGLDLRGQETTGCRVDLAEARYRYLRGLRRGERFRIATHFAAVDRVRISIVHRMMAADGTLAAEAEILYAHVRNSDQTPVPFPDGTRRRLAQIADAPF